MQASVFVFGLTCCLGLIVALGAQNLFVLRQGLQREHVWTAVSVCVASDIALISLGVVGFGWLSSHVPGARPLLTLLGLAFLCAYGWQAARRACRPRLNCNEDTPREQRRHRRSIALQAASFSWLNPHAWLDTTVLLGSIAQTQSPGQRWTFALGAACASLLWFVGLGLLARQLGPWFKHPAAWRALDVVIAITMMVLAAGLIRTL